MKRHYLVLRFLLIVFIIAFLAACQPTPEQEPVVNRGDGVYELRLEEAQQSDQVGSEAGQYVFDPHWTEEVALRNFTFRIDVDIEAPTTGAFGHGHTADTQPGGRGLPGAGMGDYLYYGNCPKGAGYPIRIYD